MRVLPNIFSTTLGLILLSGGIGAAYAADPIYTTKPECIRDPNATEIAAGLKVLDSAEKGRRAFMRMNCYSCHGMHGTEGGMGPSLLGEANEMDVVYEGDGHGMPAFKNNLCPNDVAYLTAYVQLLGTGTEPDFTHWWEINPSR